MHIPEAISASNVSIPGIIYGTAWKHERTANLVEEAISAGYRGIDTACQPRHYNEAGVGEALQRCFQKGMKREQFYLQSKYTPRDGQDPANMPYDPMLPIADQVLQSFIVSQHNLRTDYLDTLILHSPIHPFALMMEAWHGMESIAVQGGARQLGISNCYDPALLRALYDAADIKPALVQNRFYRDKGYDRELWTWCESKGIVYQSFWTLTANGHALESLSLGRLAQKYGCWPEQIFLRYVTQLGIVPLTGTTSAQHMRDDLAIFEFQLSEDEVQVINTLLDINPVEAGEAGGLEVPAG